MRNPDLTKERILQKSGALFNTHGYKSTSISDITSATGYTKGAIYTHFCSKDDLEIETLRYLENIMNEKVRACVKAHDNCGDKLRAVFRYFESYISNPPLKGGCPLLNASVEADDAHPALRRAALKILDNLHQSVVSMLDKGIRYRQIKPGIDKDYYATLVIASLEGAIMMSKLRGNNVDIKRIIKHLEKQVKEIEL